MKTEYNSRASLLRIAAALDVPVKFFFVRNRSTDTTIGADKCLRLWSEIRTEEKRLQVLEALRAFVEAEQQELATRNDELRCRYANPQDLLMETAVDTGHLHASIKAVQAERDAWRDQAERLPAQAMRRA